MAIEQTFSIIKPDAVAKNIIGEIYSLSLIHISEPTRLWSASRMPSYS